MGKNHKKKDKSQKRDVISNELINGSSKDVIFTENAMEYIQKLGYRVIPLYIERTIKTLAVVFAIFGVLIILPK